MARKLTYEIFCRFSPLHSDHGRQFESELMKEICQLLNIRKTRTTPYHPQCDGLVEKFNRIDMLATMTKQYPFDWENELQLRKVCMAYNTSVHSSTEFTPFYLMYGRQVKLPINLVYGTECKKDTPVTEYASHLKQSMEEAYIIARERIGTSHQRQKEHYDRQVHRKVFEEGNLVWQHSTVIPPEQSRKLHELDHTRCYNTCHRATTRSKFFVELRKRIENNSF